MSGGKGNRKGKKPMYRVVNVPIKPYIKKFILKHYKITEEPVMLSVDSLLGHYVYAMLALKRTRMISSNEACTETISLAFSQSMDALQFRIGYLARLNLVCEQIFKDCMRSWAMGQERIGYPVYHGLKEFLKYYGIKESEYSFESCYRDWMRYKNNEYLRSKATKQGKSTKV